MGKSVKQVDQSFFEDDNQQPTIVDESFFEEVPEKKNSGQPSVAGISPVSPSVSPLPSDAERKNQIDYLLKKNRGEGFRQVGMPVSISDHVLNQKISPREDYQLQQKREALDIASALKTPTVENIKKLAEKGIQKKVEEASTASVLDKAKLLEPGEERANVPEVDENVLKNQLTTEFNKKFIAGELNSDDIDILKSGNPLLNSGNLLSINNDQLASQINTKSSNLKEYSRAKNVDGNSYYFESRGLENSINNLEANIRNVASTGSDKIFVDANTTKLPNEVAAAVNGQIYVNREDYLAELNKKLADAKDREFFLKNDFKINRYEPVAEKHTKILIDDISKSGNIDLNAFGTGISSDEDLYIKTTVDKYLKNLNDPVINAAQGVTEQPVENREYLDIYNRVRDYFHNVVPVKGWVDNQMKHYMEGTDNQKFKPLIDNIENIHSFFDSDETQKFESVLNATTDANQAAIFDKYNKILIKSPKFNEIANAIKARIDNKELTEDQANIEIEKQLMAVPEFKPILDKENNEIKATILQATKQREQRMINAISGLPKNIILNEDGTIGLKGVSPEETKKFIQSYYDYQNQATKDAVNIVAEDRKIDADQVMEGYRKKYGGFLTSAATGLAQGYGNMMESATRWLSNSLGVADGMRDYYTTGNKFLGETVDNSEFAQKHFKYNGIRSLIDPRYYVYNVGQSASYMAPGMAATIATGGGATGAIVGGAISSTIETAQNGLQTYNELLTTGKDEFGLPMTEYKAGRAMSQQMGSEIIPNLFLQSLEFGTIFRGAKLAKPKLNILGGVGDLAKTGGAEGLQEAIQGNIQYNAQQKALGKPELDIWDYMQSDDFRQNFFGGLAGGIGFGAGGKATQLLNRSKNLKQWETLVSNANEEFKQSSFYGYATQAQMNGEGAQFRDALRLRLQNEQYKNNEEKNGLMQTLSYSAKLADATKSLGVAPGNINGLAAAHNLALADLYEDYANTGNKESALAKIYKQKASDYKSQAQEIINGNDKGVHYVMTTNGTPIFLSQQNAKVLQEEGALDNLYSKGIISAVSDNIKVDTDEAPVRVQKLETRKAEIESELGSIVRVVKDETGAEIGRTVPKENQDAYIDLSKELKNVNNSLEGLRPEPVQQQALPEEIAASIPDTEKATSKEEVEINLSNQLGEEKTKEISNTVNEFVDNDLLPETITEDEKQEAKERPLGFLKAIADQAQTPLEFDGKIIDTRERTVSKYGEEAVKLAEETFPKIEADIAQPATVDTSIATQPIESPAQLEKGITEKGKELAAKIRKLKVKTDVAAAHIFGIGVSLYNTSIDIVSYSVEIGAKLADAIARGVDYIKTNYGESLNEEEYRKSIENAAFINIKSKEELTDRLNYIEEIYGPRGMGNRAGKTRMVDFGGAIDQTELSEEELLDAVKKSKIHQTDKNRLKQNISDRGKRLAQRIRELKSPRDVAQANIFGIPIAIYDGAIETIATAIEKGSEIAQAIQEAIKYIKDNGGREVDVTGFKKHIEDYVAGEKPKIKVQVGEEEKPKVKVVVGKEDKEKEGDIIDDYKMETSGEVNKMLSGETIENVFGEKPEGEQGYDVQRLNDMLNDGRNMINMAAGKWGNDVMDYGRPLFEYVQKMSNDVVLTNKKAVLLATFLGELKDAIIREPDRKGEIQPLYNAVEQYYQQYMNKVGKELAAGRLLRLYRDKYLGDVFSDRILEEAQVKEKKRLQDIEAKKKIDDETASEPKEITKDQKDAQDKEDREKSTKAKKDQSKKKKLSVDDAKKKAEAKMEEIKNKAGDKKGLIEKINEAIKRLNCK